MDPEVRQICLIQKKSFNNEWVSPDLIHSFISGRLIDNGNRAMLFKCFTNSTAAHRCSWALFHRNYNYVHWELDCVLDKSVRGKERSISIQVSFAKHRIPLSQGAVLYAAQFKTITFEFSFSNISFLKHIQWRGQSYRCNWKQGITFHTYKICMDVRPPVWNVSPDLTKSLIRPCFIIIWLVVK